MNDGETFFKRNTIPDWQRDYNLTKRHSLRSIRAESVSSLRLNPQNFSHREVFNSQMYQRNGPFTVNLEQLKTDFNSKANLCINKADLTELAASKPVYSKETEKFIDNFNRHVKMLTEQQPGSKHLQALSELLTSFLKFCLGQNIKSEKSLQEVSSKLVQAHAQLKTARAKNIEAQTTSASILISRKQIDRMAAQTKQHKSFKQKYKVLLFANQQLQLKNEQLLETLQSKDKDLAGLGNKLSELLQEKAANSQFRQDMQYKVKRLKEELEVAHVVKEQNLADKMNYIMGW